MTDKPKRKRAKPGESKKKLPITVRQEKFAEGILQGKTQRQAYVEAGYADTEHSRFNASHAVRRPVVQEYIRERLSGLHATTDEVLNLLADHLRIDIGDFDGCINEDGSLDLKEAKKRGISRLVKKVRSRVVNREDHDGNPIHEVNTEIEFHDSQAAAVSLAKILGIQQKPRANEADTEKQRQMFRQFVQDAMEKLDMPEDKAAQWVKDNVPVTRDWVM